MQVRSVPLLDLRERMEGFVFIRRKSSSAGARSTFLWKLEMNILVHYFWRMTI
jgi:hypothetical protein